MIRMSSVDQLRKLRVGRKAFASFVQKQAETVLSKPDASKAQVSRVLERLKDEVNKFQDIQTRICILLEDEAIVEADASEQAGCLFDLEDTVDRLIERLDVLSMSEAAGPGDVGTNVRFGVGDVKVASGATTGKPSSCGGHIRNFVSGSENIGTVPSGAADVRETVSVGSNVEDIATNVVDLRKVTSGTRGVGNVTKSASKVEKVSSGGVGQVSKVASSFDVGDATSNAGDLINAVSSADNLGKVASGARNDRSAAKVAAGGDRTLSSSSSTSKVEQSVTGFSTDALKMEKVQIEQFLETAKGSSKNVLKTDKVVSSTSSQPSALNPPPGAVTCPKCSCFIPNESLDAHLVLHEARDQEILATPPESCPEKQRVEAEGAAALKEEAAVAQSSAAAKTKRTKKKKAVVPAAASRPSPLDPPPGAVTCPKCQCFIPEDDLENHLSLHEPSGTKVPGEKRDVEKHRSGATSERKVPLLSIPEMPGSGNRGHRGGWPFRGRGGWGQQRFDGSQQNYYGRQQYYGPNQSSPFCGYMPNHSNYEQYYRQTGDFRNNATRYGRPNRPFPNPTYQAGPFRGRRDQQLPEEQQRRVDVMTYGCFQCEGTFSTKQAFDDHPCQREKKETTK